MSTIFEGETAVAPEGVQAGVAQVQGALADAAATVRHEATGLATRISELVTDEIDQRLSGFSEGLLVMAERLRDVSDDLAATESSPEAKLAPMLLERGVEVLEDVALRFDGTTVTSLRGRVGSISKEHPFLFAAACLGAGLLAGRFAVASAKRMQADAASRETGDDTLRPVAPSDADWVANPDYSREEFSDENQDPPDSGFAAPQYETADMDGTPDQPSR